MHTMIGTIIRRSPCSAPRRAARFGMRLPFGRRAVPH